MNGIACPHGPFPICECARHVARSKLSEVVTATSTSTSDQSADDQRTEQSSDSSDSALAERLAKLQGAFWKGGGDKVVPMDIIDEDDAVTHADVAVESDEETAVESDDDDEGPGGLGPTLSRCDSQSTGTRSRSKWQTEYRARRGSRATDVPGSEVLTQDTGNGSQSGASEVGTDSRA